jgi:hypothetical protein
MDQKLLVGPDIDASKRLVSLMDNEGLAPRAALWVYNEDTESWRLWIVPSSNVGEKVEFYRRLAVIVAENRDVLGGLDTSSTEFVKDSHPAIAGLRGVIRVAGLSEVRFSNNMLNGFYLPDAIILRMAV